jgi:hypothetical protein
MASHLSTPRSIREAPGSHPVLLHETRGPNRKDRRHGGGGWIGTDPNGVKSSLHGAKANGFFKRTKNRKELVDRQGRRITVITPGPTFAEAYPSQNEPYRKPTAQETLRLLAQYAEQAATGFKKLSAAIKKLPRRTNTANTEEKD